MNRITHLSINFILLLTALITLSCSTNQNREGTTFTCSSNQECKEKCEALGSDHTWKPNPGGSTFGTCTKRMIVKRPGQTKDAKLPPTVLLDSIGLVSDNAAEIINELNVLFSKSSVVSRLGLQSFKINSASITLGNQFDGFRTCASCLGDGITVELCCPPEDPHCAFPCIDGRPF